MVKYLFCFLFSLSCLGAFAQGQPKIEPETARKPLTYWQKRDSIQRAEQLEKQRLADSIKHVQDSLQMLWLKPPDPNRPNLFLDSLKELYTVKNGDFFTWTEQFSNNKKQFMIAPIKLEREQWIVGIIIALFLVLAIIRLSYPAQTQVMFQGFYNNRVLAQVSKEDSLFNSWPFIFLYLLFGFTIGMFLFLVSKFTRLGGVTEGINLYVAFSVSVLILFTIKIITVRFLGFLFDISRLVREYVSILYLSYFNAALLFLPVVLIMALSPRTLAKYYIIFAFVMLVGIFILQFLRASGSIFKTYSLSKFYLILYLCALEIGPILILIKVLGF